MTVFRKWRRPPSRRYLSKVIHKQQTACSALRRCPFRFIPFSLRKILSFDKKCQLCAILCIHVCVCVCACVYVYMYVYTHTHIHTHTHTHNTIYIKKDLNIYIYIYIYIYSFSIAESARMREHLLWSFWFSYFLPGLIIDSLFKRV